MKTRFQTPKSVRTYERVLGAATELFQQKGYQRTTMRDISSDVGSFVAEKCELGEVLQIPKTELYRAFVDWCHDDRGRKNVINDNQFASELYAVCPGVCQARPRTSEGERLRVYRGITLR